MEKTEVKKGWKTSEFWLAATLAAASLFNEAGVFSFKIPLDVLEQAWAGVMTYIGSRSFVKAAAAYAAAKVKPDNTVKVND